MTAVLLNHMKRSKQQEIIPLIYIYKKKSTFRIKNMKFDSEKYGSKEKKTTTTKKSILEHSRKLLFKVNLINIPI